MDINIRNTGAGEHVHVQCYIMWQYMYVYVLWLDMLSWPCEVHVCQKMWNLLMWIIVWYETVLNLYSCSRCLAVFICNLAPKSHLLICIHCEKDVLLRRIDNHKDCHVAFWKNLNFAELVLWKISSTCVDTNYHPLIFLRQWPGWLGLLWWFRRFSHVNIANKK